jgi:thiol-disulfide isomerase/thioredoxin
MRQGSFIAWAVFAALTGVCAARAGEKTISGAVVDGKGQPQSGVQIAVEWNCSGKDFQLAPRQKIESDSAGQFSGKVPCGDGPVAILALDKARARGVLRVVPAEEVERPLRLQLAPLVTASAEVVLGEFEKRPESVRLELVAQVGNAKLFSFDADATKIKLKLPVGAYTLSAAAPDAVTAATEFDLDADEPDYDCGKLQLAPKPGKGSAASSAVPAFKITDAIGVDKNMKLADYKGKWVMIDFWGYWCGPCVNIGLPALFKFAREHEADASKFVILTFHQGSEKTLAECKAQFDRLNQKLWKIEKFPFPIVMDATGETVRPRLSHDRADRSDGSAGRDGSWRGARPVREAAGRGVDEDRIGFARDE